MTPSPSPRSLLCAALSLVAGLAPLAARADGGDGDKIEISAVELESLLDLSVEAVTRTAVRASEAPAAVFVLTRDDLRRHGFRTLQEVLGSVPGFFSYTGVTSQVGVRGMGVLGDFTTRLLMLIDGHPLHTQYVDLHRGFPVPLDAIQRVEVIKGPVGSVYGSSAFFGVVNLVTAGAGPGAEVWAGAEAAQRSVRAGEISATGRGAAGALEGLISVDAYSSGGRDFTYPELAAVGTPGGKLAGMDFGDSESGYARVRWRQLAASAACVHSFGGLTASRVVDHRNVLENLTCFADLTWRGDVTRELTITPRVAFDSFDQRAGRVDLEPPLGLGLLQNKGYDRWITGELRADWRPLASLRLDAGTTVQLHTDSSRSSATAGAFDVTLHKDYATVNTWLLAELRPRADLSLHGGLTFFSHSVFGKRFTPKVAAVWQPTPDDTVKAIWSMGFRPPTLVEALFADGAFYLANPELKPEKVQSAELVYERRLGGLASVSASVFWNHYQDLIRRETVPATDLGRAPDPANPRDFRQIAVNAGGLRLVGGELAFTLRWKDWIQAYGGVSVQRVDEAARPNFPGLTANLAVSTRALWRPLLLSVRVAGTSARAKDPATVSPGQRSEVPAFASVGALAALDVPGVPGLQLEVSVANALGTRNVSPGVPEARPVSELPESPRTLRADLRWRL